MFMSTGMRMLPYMLAFWETSKRCSLNASKSRSAACSWQKAFTTFWPFMISSTCPSTTPSSLCCATKKRAELPPSTLVMKTMNATPATMTRHIHTEKYSMMTNTVTSTTQVWNRLGSDWEIIWRMASMSLV